MVIGKKPTLFFDWLITDIKSVTKILLNYNNIDSILNKNNIVKNPNIPIHDNCSRVLFNNLSLCESVHDLKISYDDTDIEKFIIKYKRRLNRIIDYILSNELLCFIRYGNIDESEKNNFIETILKINPNCKFKLVSVSLSNEKNSIIKETYYISICILHNEIYDDWTTSALNWNEIFLIIQQNF